MYEIPDAGPGEFDPGTNLLVAGTDRAAVREFAAAATCGSGPGAGAVAVLTGDAPPPGLADHPGRVVTVDCGATLTRTDGMAVHELPGPGDLSALGVAVSERLASFADEGATWVLVDSVCGLMPHADEEAVFRFLHVLGGRIENAGALGLFVLDETACGEPAAGTLRPVFDGVLTVARDGRPEYTPAVTGPG